MALAQVTTAWAYEGVPFYLQAPICPLASASQQSKATMMASLTVLEMQLGSSTYALSADQFNDAISAMAQLFNPYHPSKRAKTGGRRIQTQSLSASPSSPTSSGAATGAATGATDLEGDVRWLSEWMQQQGVAPFFPKIAEQLQIPLLALNDIHEYMNQLALINQTASLAFQLKADIDFINHKYMAHQIALLFLSLGQINSPLFTAFKQRIEVEFESIKAASSADVDAPQISPDQKAWLHTLTEDIINMALSLPSELGGTLVSLAENMQTT